MPRELRLDFAGNSYKWFDVDHMMKVHGQGLTEVLTEDIMQYFKVPLEYQILCDAEGPVVSSTDLRRLLLGMVPRLWLFDARYMGTSLKAQCEKRMEGICFELGASKSRLSLLMPPPPPPLPPQDGAASLLPWAVAWQEPTTGLCMAQPPATETMPPSPPRSCPLPFRQRLGKTVFKQWLLVIFLLK
ncbi:unnamed protein product [Polarella glacialis]|uniref:Uncharacterized protein n=1 Tax=Polarella glacialis TaxID=89957 RepID=A0A813IXN7_POLGL|nr:unnamed protein product [Polarella glacialis]